MQGFWSVAVGKQDVFATSGCSEQSSATLCRGPGHSWDLAIPGPAALWAEQCITLFCSSCEWAGVIKAKSSTCAAFWLSASALHGRSGLTSLVWVWGLELVHAAAVDRKGNPAPPVIVPKQPDCPSFGIHSSGRRGCFKFPPISKQVCEAARRGVHPNTLNFASQEHCLPHASFTLTPLPSSPCCLSLGSPSLPWLFLVPETWWKVVQMLPCGRLIITYG